MQRTPESDLVAIEYAFGAWTNREFDGEEYVENLRSGDRLRQVILENWHLSECQAGILQSRVAKEAAMTVTEQREMQVDAALHSAEIEGLTVSEDTRTDADSYIAGRIDSTELVDRVRARYGLS